LLGETAKPQSTRLDGVGGVPSKLRAVARIA
jgi:hypothetical protein